MLAAGFCAAQTFSALGQSATDGDIRLENGTDSAEGRVEVYLEGQWGTVCDDFWGLEDATVACRQAGYLGALQALSSAAFGEGSGPIHLDDVECAGTEQRLVDCIHRRFNNCDHSEDAGVVCDNSASITVTPDSVSVGEEDALGGQYLVALDVVPLGDTVIAVSGTSGTDVMVSPAMLTFTSANWDRLQTVTVTAVDDADTANDEVTLMHRASGGGYGGAHLASVHVTVVDNDGTNTTPVFDEGAATTRSVAENSATGSNVGAPVAATDGDHDTLSYSLLGADSAHFSIDSSNGQIKSSGALDYETGALYRMSVKADDGTGASDTINVTVNVSDVAEPPVAPARPTLVVATRVDLKVRWSAPDNAGRPPIESYDLQYRDRDSPDFTAGPQDLTGTRATITGLTMDTEYHVQVRASNDEGDGDWSASLVARTDLPISSDADLASLSVHDGGSDVDLVPAFSAAVRSYTAAVEANVGVATVNAEPNNDRARLAFDPPDADTDTGGIQFTLALGANNMTITVTAEDGTTQSYGLTVRRPNPCTSTTVAVTGVSSNPSEGLISDCNILLAARDVLRGEADVGTPGLNWSTDLSMARWRAVKVRRGRVTELDTRLNNDFFSNSLKGVLPATLGDLTELEVLRFQNVGLGGEIPAEIGNLAKLRTLDLSLNRDSAIVSNPDPGLTGSIPESLGDLEMLTTLELNVNSLGGRIPNSLRRLTSLTTLDLSNNVEVNFLALPVNDTTGLEGSIPSWLDELSDLETLDLEFNRLTGRIPRLIGELTELDKLYLAKNYLTGCIPRSLEEFRREINPQRDPHDIRATNDLPDCPVPRAPTVIIGRNLIGEIPVTYSASVTVDGVRGEPITHFEYRLSTDGGTTWSPDWMEIPDSGPGESNHVSYILGGLVNGTEHTLEMRAVNIDGDGGVTRVTATPREPSSDATLSALTLQDGSTEDVRLNPLFAPTSTNYTAMVGQSTESVTVVATPTDANATVASTPRDEIRFTRGFQISVDTGLNDIQLTVTAEDSTEMDYGLTVIRNPSDDPAGVEVDATELSIDEGEAGTYTVVLAAEPVALVTIGVGVTSDDGVTAGPAQLTFSTTNWNTAQTVQVAAPADADAVDGSATVTHSASGAGYEWVDIPSVAVTVVDNDIEGVTLSTESLTIVEGLAGVYTVVLETKPTGPVTVTPSAPAGSDVGVSPAALTFATDSWHVTQSLTVTAESDDDGEDDAATLTHTVGGGGYGGVAVSTVEVTVTDDDTKGVIVSQATLQLDEEGGGSAYTVALATEPTGRVTVNADAPSGSDLVIGPRTLTFTTTNWKTARSITVAAGADDDSDDDEDAIIHTASGGGYTTVAVPSVQVHVVDDDVAGVIFSTLSLGVVENGSATYTARLGGVPQDTVTVTPSVPGGSPVTVASDDLVFTTGNWQTMQNVTVTAAADDDTADEQVYVSHVARGGSYDSAKLPDVLVTVTDDDTAGVTLSAATLVIDEGDASSYSVMLVTEPSGTVTLTAEVRPGDSVDVSPAELDFTVANWRESQTVTVSALDDDDAADGEAMVSHTVVGGGYDAVSVGDVAITVRDDDAAGVRLSASELTVDEGSSGTYGIALATRPVEEVKITVDAPSTGEIGASPGTLTFDATNWQTEQAVTVRAGHDDDAEDEREFVSHSASGGDYADVAVDRVGVRVVDDDEAGVSLSATAVTVGEGSTASYEVVLDTEPTGAVRVTVDAPAGSDLDASPASVDFDAVNWRSPQVVILRAGDDADADDEQVVVSHAASGADYGGVSVAGMTVTVIDDDMRSVNVSTTALVVDEGGSETYTVRLGTEPTASVVTIGVGVTSDDGVTAGPAQLTFSTTNWNTAQTVQVAAPADADAVDGSATVTHSASGAGYEWVDIPSVAVTVVDNDIEGVTLSTESLTIVEGLAGVYTVVLETKPTGPVTVTPSAPAGSDVGVSPAALTFATDSWHVTQSLTVTAESDDDGEDDAATLTHTVGGGGYGGVAVSTVEVTVTDDDTKGVIVSQATLQLDEEGGGSAYTVALATEPTGRVTVNADAPSGSDLVIGPRTLTFTTTNWKTARSITVAAGADDDSDDDEDAIIHTASGGGYTTVAVPSVQVHVVDDDVAGVIFSTLSLGVVENGSATYTARLGGVPQDTVTVTPSVPGGSPVTVASDDLVFTTGNWQTMQNVTVTAAADDDTADEQVYVSHVARGGSYDSAKLPDVLVTVTDDDTAGVTLSAATLVIDEGDASSYSVMLVTEPSGTVTLTAEVRPGDSVDVSPAELDFTVANWRESQTVTVSALDDDDAADGEAMVSHTVVGGGYDAVSVGDVAITVRDDDAAGVRLSASELTVDEGSSGTYGIALATRPVEEVKITVDAPSTGEIGASPGTLTFDATNWQTEQAVTVRAGHDDDAEDEREFVSHSASGGDYADVAVDRVGVRVVDDDEAGVSLSATAVTVGEGSTASYEVVLDTEPTGAVRVTVDAPAGSDLDASPASVDFDAVNWRSPQVVILRAGDDADADDEQVVVSHAASGADYGGVSVAGMTVTVIDDDMRSVNVSTTALVVDEGGSETYTVRLGTEPTASVIVTPDVTSGTGVDVSPTSLTFLVADWRAAHTVTVTGEQDDDAEDDAATVTHAVRGGGFDGIRVASVAVTVRDNDRELVLIGARAEGNRVTLVFDQLLDLSPTAEPGDFDAEIDEGEGSWTEAVEVVAVGVVADTVRVTLARVLENGEQVTISYTPGVNPIRSEGGVPAVAFTVRAALPAPGAATTPRALLFASAANPDRQGFVRIINHSAASGTVEVEAIDDSGMRVGPVALTLQAGATAHFNSDDLEAGNADKGLPQGVGPASFGNWRLEMTSDLDIEVLSYARTSDGFVTSLHDALPVQAGVHRSVVFFNPAENINQESRLRLVNPEVADANVTITGTDDSGEPSRDVQVALPAGASVDLTASELESGTGRGIEEGALGRGEGKWRLQITSDAPIIAMSLLHSRGRLTNLSTAQRTGGILEGSFAVLLFPPASDPELQGFVRVINRSRVSGTVRIEAFDDTDIVYDTPTLLVGPGEVGSFNSDDLEIGNPEKDMTGSTGAGRGDWRLELSSELDIEVLAYIRTTDGFVTAMHDLAPVTDGVHRVVFLNPASNPNQVGRIRIVNPGETEAAVTITGVDGAGASPGEPVQATVGAREYLELTSAELETGVGEGVDSGALGDGFAKWLLEIESDQTIHVMSLLRSPTGHLTNLSTSPNWSPCGAACLHPALAAGKEGDP